ncbi:MAG TPA: c-type cytochrome domain-containing protein, partial [Edaphobacter sp.]|nr:c-type cytochrome domain-containing protein [Edaphobacter sp.]
MAKFGTFLLPFVAVPTLKLLVACALLPAYAVAADPAPGQVEFFEKKVRPVLAGRCYACHSAETKPAGGLRVDDRNGLLTGGDSGPAIIPGEPEKSLLLQRIRHANSKPRMPKEGALLTDAEVADLTAWIQAGVAWPAEKMPASIGQSKAFYERLKARHWAYQPLIHPEVPKVSNTSWVRGDIDRFILSKLEEKNLAPVADADRTT